MHHRTFKKGHFLLHMFWAFI